MKAVILAGGLGTRMREETEFKPKPMVEIGNMPVLLHLMKLLGAQGIREFVVCVGYRGDFIRDYFLNFQTRFADFTVSTRHDRQIEYHSFAEVPDWEVTVAETGPLTPTGGRIKAVEKYIRGERFFATYGDGLANVNLADLVDSHERSGKTATITLTQPRSRFGVAQLDDSGTVKSFLEKPEGSELVNMGFFIFEPQIFGLLHPTSTLEADPLQALVDRGQLNAYHHSGFFQPMDTQREVDEMRDLWRKGNAPWKIWED